MPITLEPSGNPQVYTLTFPSDQTKFSSDDRQTFLKKLDLEYLLTQNNLTLSIDDGAVEEALHKNSCLKYCCSKSTAVDRVFDEIAGLNKQKSNSIANGEEVKASDTSKLRYTLTPKNSDTTLEETDNINKTITIETIANSTEEFEITLNYTPPSSEDQAIREYFSPKSGLADLAIITTSIGLSFLSVIEFIRASRNADSAFPAPFYSANYTNTTKVELNQAETIGSFVTNFSLNGYYLYLVTASLLLFSRAKTLNKLLYPSSKSDNNRIFLQNLVNTIFSSASAIPFLILTLDVDKLPLWIAVPTFLVYTALHYSGIKFVSASPKKLFKYCGLLSRKCSQKNENNKVLIPADLSSLKLYNKIKATPIESEHQLNEYRTANIALKKIEAYQESLKTINYHILFGATHLAILASLIYVAKCAIEGYGDMEVNDIKGITGSFWAIIAFMPFISIILKVAQEQAMGLTSSLFSCILKRLSAPVTEELTIQEQCRKCSCQAMYTLADFIILVFAILSPGPALWLNQKNHVDQSPIEMWSAIFGTTLFNASAGWSIASSFKADAEEKTTASNQERFAYLHS